MAPQFHIREGESAKGDGRFIAEAFDAAIPHLGSIGSSAQWGSDPLSTTEGFSAKLEKAVEDAEKYRLTGEGDAVTALIAEAEVPEGEEAGLTSGPGAGAVAGGKFPVAAATVKDEWWPEYIKNTLADKIVGKENFAYLHILISDFRAGKWRRGSGAELVAEVKERAKKSGKKTLFVDCWAGNGRKLVGFYLAQGFVHVDDFSVDRPGKGPFDGALLRMEL
ncbi:uncharacterized protein DNG_08032 [Cephalotrichum gorgonifer]|uniref:N-acetyltransferase domain-containing protein n=1 Tax=Cephalotrichum gorgonifer TaxID=2041049 RepID=A0AAE8N2Z5_9PEZI|nr:uncharacterized protein DNG_08032 [Cephalotrichum gorgonifer]